jgi:hypothetical protein
MRVFYGTKMEGYAHTLGVLRHDHIQTKPKKQINTFLNVYRLVSPCAVGPSISISEAHPS